MNKRTVALDKEQYNEIITLIRNGFSYDNSVFKPNKRLATLLVVQANLGVRISDILNLKLCDIVKDGNRYRLNIVEQKTKKQRTFTIVPEIYDYIKSYAEETKLGATTKLFPISERNVQKQLKIVTDYLGLENVSTHSFRKFYATEIYINNDYDAELVRHLLQHSSIAITQKYLGISNKRVEKAISNHLCLV